MIFTGSTDRITSADATQRPESIRLFSSRPSRGREETSAYHGSNGYLEEEEEEEGGVLKQAAFSTMHCARNWAGSAMQQMQCNANPEHRIKC